MNKYIIEQITNGYIVVDVSEHHDRKDRKSMFFNSNDDMFKYLSEELK